MSFLGELKRRNVFKVAVAYLVASWIVVQVITVLSDPLDLPDILDTIVVLLLAVGFPFALIIAWAFEVTPEGLKLTSEVDRSVSITSITGQRLNYIVTGLLAVALGFMIVDQYLLEDANSGAAVIEASAPPATPDTSTLPAAGTRLPNSVAVLPLENFSPNPDDAYFAAGIHEEILNYLARLRSLNIIARTSMAQYANTDKTVPQIAEELNVETVMEGSVRYAGDRVRVTTQLIDAGTGAHLWSDAYESDFEDIFAIQADIAMNVANALNAEFSLEEQRDIETPPTTSTAAYALFLQYLELAGTDNLGPTGLALLDRIIALDPNFAAAYGAKAGLYGAMLINTTLSSAGEAATVEALARENADRALELDPKNGGAHTALANIELFRWRWPEARVVYERYERETGRRAQFHGWFDAWSGRYDAAIEASERSVALNPRIWAAYWNLGIALTYAGRYDDAAMTFQEGIDLAPILSAQHSWLGLAELARGNNAAALSSLQLAEQLLGNNRVLIALLDLIYGYGRIGRDDEARRLFEEVESLAEQQDIGAGGWALAYLGIGDEERALEALREGAEKAASKEIDPGFFSLMNLKVNFTGDPRLELPEFVAVRNQLSGD